MSKKYADYRGLRNLVAAEILTDNGTEFTCGKWHELEGAVSVSIEGEESTAAIYRDDLAVRNITTEGPDTATVNMDVLSNKVRAWLEGRQYDEASGVYFKTPKKVKNFVFGFIGGLSDGTEEAVIMYNTSVTGGNAERNTKDDGTDVTTVEYTFTGVYTKTKFNVDNADGTLIQPVKSVTIPLNVESGNGGYEFTEEFLFGTFTDGVSTIEPRQPDALLSNPSKQ